MFEAYYKMTTSHLGHTMLSHEDFCTPNLADEPVLLYQSLDIESQGPLCTLVLILTTLLDWTCTYTLVLHMHTMLQGG